MRLKKSRELDEAGGPDLKTTQCYPGQLGIEVAWFLSDSGGSSHLVSSRYLGHSKEEHPYLGDLLTKVIYHLLTGMVLQVGHGFSNLAFGA